jgi:hypothetical protein
MAQEMSSTWPQRLRTFGDGKDHPDGQARNGLIRKGRRSRPSRSSIQTAPQPTFSTEYAIVSVIPMVISETHSGRSAHQAA